MRAVLKLTINYDNDTISSDKDIKRILSYAAQYLANNGLLSDEHSIIDEWGFIVEVSTQEGGE